MNIRKHIPNSITCLNLVSGCIASVMAFHGFILHAFIWIIIAAVLDFFDGFAARLLKAYSPIGKDLDSLADVVSFGVAPGMMVYYLLNALANSGNSYTMYSVGFFAFIIPALSAVRLAKFNNDTRQTESFIGLPVPAHALFWASAVYFFYTHPTLLEGNPVVFITIGIIAITAISLLLISEIPMFSLKVKSLGWKGNELRYILIIAAIGFFILFGLSGVSLTIFLYVVISWLTGRKQE